ncbi:MULTISPECIES: hemolysin family protein [Sphingobacterium]|uniref:HlyC/CorC family transporter n=1 Tax=Sphingobacterium litopenaei TaxID=2763500 RepID=A0ABR7YDC4_9SPHI|nr:MULTISPECIES: hemolysin family protein [Sphingobacterium]MBD1429314.1 HlyC/CorC family transporter [Sphingobacterium litopenaei]NGM71971.1 HlyC/CorC family transporter [Sphingobacterium sp. SGL-16]
MITEIVVILVLMVLNGILSASEIAIVSSRKARLQSISDENAGAKRALKLKDDPNQFLSTVQIGITLIGILTGFFSGGSISTYIAEHLKSIPSLAPYSDTLSVGIVVLIITYMSLVIGELVPKRIGMAIPEKYASLISRPMDILSKIVKPFVWSLSVSTDFIVKLLNIKTSSNAVTEEEIKALVDEGVTSGVIEGFEHDLVDRLLTIGDKRALNIMVHRNDITYLDIQDSFEEMRKYILKSNHTEYPVCDGHFDNMKGIISVKDLLKAFLLNDHPDIEKLIQPIPFVNENSGIYSVLEILKSSRVTQAVVIDEYGTPQGIITLKDILGNLVGTFDEEAKESKSKLVRLREDGSYIIDGRCQLDDFFEKFEIHLSEDDEDEISNITTVGGLVFLYLDHIPAEGESITYKGYHLEVIDMDGNRIDKVAMTKIKSLNSDITDNID